MRRSRLAMIGLGVPVRWPLVLALAVAAGCGQSDGASSAPPRTSATATATIAEIAPTAGELAGRIAGSLAGVHTVTATVSLGAPGGGASALAATLALDTDATAADIDVRTAGGDHDRVRIRDGVVYLRGPGVASLTHGRPWIRAGLDEVVGLAAAGGSPAVAGGQQGLPQPDRVAALLLGSLSPGVPHAAAYGTSTGPHYPVTMPLSTVEQLGAALDLSPRTPAGARVSAWTNRLAQRGVTALTGDLVLDRRGRPLRLVAAPAGDPAGRDRVTVTFADWGAPVAVAVPSGDQVREVSAAELASLMPPP